MKYLLIIILLFVGVITNAQDITIPLNGMLKNSDNGTKLGGVSVTLKHNGSAVTSTETASNGKFALTGNGPITGKYQLVFSKPGMITKIIEMNFSDIDLELLPAGNEVSFQPFDIDLFADPVDIDFSFLESEPVASFSYSDRDYAMVFDERAANKMKAKIQDKLLEAEKAKEQVERDYQQAMVSGEMNMSNGNYEKAVADFEKAQTLKPMAPEPAQKLMELDALIQKQKEEALAKEQADAGYQKLLDEGDALMASTQYDAAIVKYNSALAMKNEQYPKDQIKEAQRLIEAKKKEEENQAKYDQAIAAASGFESANKLQDALAKYKEANSLKPSEKLPQDKIKELEAKINEKEAAEKLEADYAKAIADGNAFFAGNKLEEALKEFEKAAALKPSESLPKQKIIEIKKLLDEQNANAERDKQIKELMASGKTAMTKNELESAKSKFQEVLGLDKNHAEAIAKLAEVEDLIAKRDKGKEQDELFAQLKNDGMSLFDGEKYEESRAKFTAALDIKNDPQIRLKLNEIDRLIAEKSSAAENKARYDKLIGEAGALEASEKFQAAIDKYREAGNLMPDETLPPTKIAALTKKLNDQNALAEDQAAIRKFIDQGDALVVTKQYPQAIDAYNEALKIDSRNQEAIDKKENARKLAEDEVGEQENEMFEKILNTAREKADEKNYDKAFDYINRAKGLKPDDKRPEELRKQIQEQKDREEKYAKLMDEGNRSAASKNYDAALNQFQLAVDVIPTDEAKAKVEEMKGLIATNADAAEKERLYNEYMDEGKRFKSLANYKSALSSFQNALNVVPNDKPASDEIAEIQQLLDDLENKEEAFQTAMGEGDAAFKKEEYLAAKEKYGRALELKPDSKLAKVQYDESIRLEHLRTIEQEEAKYKELIAKGDESFSAEAWDNARDYFSRAVNIRPSDPYPKQKLAEIDAKLNPAVVKSPELEDLGIPFTGSILDAEALFVDDTRKAKSSKGVKVTALNKDITESEIDMTDQKTVEHRDKTAHVEDVLLGIESDTKLSNDEQQKLNNRIELGKREVEVKDREDARLEYNESVFVGDVVGDVNRELAEDYNEDHQVYFDYAQKVKEIYRSQEDENLRKSDVEHDEVTVLEDRLRSIDEDLEENANLDREGRYEVSKDVEDLGHEVAQIRLTESEREYGSAKETHVEIDKFDKEKEGVFVEDQKKAQEDVKQFREIDRNTYNEDYYRSGQERNITLRNDDLLQQEEKRTRLADIENEENQRDKAESLRITDAQLMTDNQKQINEENKHYVKNSKSIEDEVARAEERKSFGYEVQNDSRKKAIKIEEGTLEMNEQYARGDGSGISSTVDRLETIESDLSFNQAQSEKGIKDKGNQLEDVDRSIEAMNDNKNASEKADVYGTNDAIGDIKPEEKPVKTVMVNSLGKEYPEGVSQEIFTQLDDSGLVKAVIIRRIVVVDGHADVHVKTKGRSATTYSKNGQPSLEYIWQTETQNPKLERHY